MLRKLPNRISFQWHITDTCNFRCKHCYQDDYTDNGVPFETQLNFLNQLEKFVVAAKHESKLTHSHINFTGGEPFLRPDFLDLLKHTSKKGLFSFGILSNGYLPPSDTLKELSALKPRFVQISLEGDKKMNDSIRGSGSYDKIINALDTYSHHNIPVMVSFTANSKNYLHFPELVRIARKHKAFKLWTDRYLPNSANDKLVLDTKQTKDFFEIILREQKKNKRRLFSKIQITSNRALQFLVSGGPPYRCSAGDTLLAILPNGDILPCRRLSIKLGSLIHDDLVDLYKSNKIASDINKLESNDTNCDSCYYKESCRGGLKCLSHAIHGDYNMKDPNCWL